MTVFIPPYAPSYSTSVSKEYRSLTNEFGDGYEAIIPDGLNNIRETWEVVWNNISDDDADDIEDQLNALAGNPFDWITPKGVTKQFVCGKISRSYTGYQTGNLSATFKEFF